MPQKHICSVYFLPCDATRPYIPMDRSTGYGAYPFHIDACAPGEHKLLAVPDCLDRVYVGNRNYMDIPVYADDMGDGHSGLARCLVSEWAFHIIGASGDVGPGVGVISGTVPTDAELRTLITRQLRYCEFLILQAEDAWTKNKKGDIGPQARLAAKWYVQQCDLDGAEVPLAFRDLVWVTLRPGERVEYKPCPQCMQKYDVRAVVCPNGHVIDFSRYQQYLVRKAEVERLAASIIVPVAQGPVPDDEGDDEPSPTDPAEPDSQDDAGNVTHKTYTCEDCGAEFDRMKRLVKHRLECTRQTTAAVS